MKLIALVAAATVSLSAAQGATMARLKSDARHWIKTYHATGQRAASWTVQPCTQEGDGAACAFTMHFRHGDRVFITCRGVSHINGDGSYGKLDIACVA